MTSGSNSDAVIGPTRAKPPSWLGIGWFWRSEAALVWSCWKEATARMNALYYVAVRISYTWLRAANFLLKYFTQYKLLIKFFKCSVRKMPLTFYKFYLCKIYSSNQDLKKSDIFKLFTACFYSSLQLNCAFYWMIREQEHVLIHKPHFQEILNVL